MRWRVASVIATYVLSLLATIVLLVAWVIYIARSVNRIQALAGRVGMPSANSHWILLGIGCALFFLVIVGLTHQLAQFLTSHRFARQQEEFLSNVTHELKSPVAAIKLHGQTLLEPGLTDDQRHRSIGHVLQQADRVSALVDDILESSRLVARKKRLDLEPVNLGAFLDRYFESARPRVEGEGMQLATEIETDVEVLASEEGLQRILDNLLDNAVTHSHRGGEVRCRIHDEDDMAVIEVEDDGIGIPKGELGKIFDRFYQIGRELRDRRKGSGLGLSIVAGLVKEMSGTVQAFSRDDRPGARFVVRLPRLAT